VQFGQKIIEGEYQSEEGHRKQSYGAESERRGVA
jgi:hypothetical protein